MYNFFFYRENGNCFETYLTIKTQDKKKKIVND